MFDKLKKRRAFPVPDLDDTCIRLLTLGERKRLDNLPTDDDRAALWFGLVVCDPQGQPQCPQGAEESDIDFVARIKEGAEDIDDSVFLALRSAFNKLCAGEQVPVEDIAKN